MNEICEGPLDCHKANEANCTRCGRSWTADDTNTPGSCPGCFSGLESVKIERCEDCPLRQLDIVRSTSKAGDLLTRILDLEFSIETFKPDWSEISAEECKGLIILKEEREKYKQEVSERERMEGAMRSQLKG